MATKITTRPRSRSKAHKPARSNAWHAYEALKTSLTAQATNSTEYEQACRQAALIAGV
jgi:hypothetical protein